MTPEITSALEAPLTRQRLRIARGFVLGVLVAAGFSACGTNNGSGETRTRWPSDKQESWAPDGQRIVFASDRAPGSRWFQIYTIRIDGTGLRRLTAVAAQSEDPAWAPSGQWIAYDVEAGGQPGIYVIRPNGTGRRRLTRGNDTNPLWSPDGSKIAFTHSSDSPLAIGDLYVIDASGGDPHRVTKSAADFDWSPDGTKLAFSSLGSTGIYVVGISDPRTVAVTRNPAADTPSWSPKGDQIAFLVGDLPGRGVAVASVPSGRARQIAAPEVDGLDWLHDGTRLVVSRNKEVDLLALSNHALRRLSRPGHFPLVSPDGRKVAFQRLGPMRYAYGDFTSAVFIIQVSGHGLHVVTEKSSKP